MAAKLRAGLQEKALDRAIVYVGENHCKSLLASLNQHTSYAVLIPLSGTESSNGSRVLNSTMLN
jgi:hypothetical protein